MCIPPKNFYLILCYICVLSNLTKFIIKTRMKSPRYIFYLILLIFSFFVNILYFRYNFQRPYILGYLVIVLISTFIIIPLFLSGNIIIQSDNDFLLNIPLKKKDLFKSYFFFSSIKYSIIFIIFLYLIGLALNSYKIIIGIFDALLLYLISIGLSYISSYMIHKKYPLILFIIYLFSPLIYNYKFNMNSVFFGNIIYGSASSIVIFIIIFYYIFSRSYKLDFLTFEKPSEKTYKSRNLKGKPLNVIYKLNTIYSNTVYIFGISKKRYHFSRNIYFWLIIYAGLGTGYFILNYIFDFTGIPRFDLFLYTWELTFYPLIFRIATPWASERAWLAFSVMNPCRYIRHYMISRSLAIPMMMSPLILSMGLVYSFHPDNFNLMLLIYSLTIPASMMLAGIYVSGISYPFQALDLSSYPSSSLVMNNFRKTLTPMIIVSIPFIFPFLIIFTSSDLIYFAFYLYSVLLILYDFYILSGKKMIEIKNNMEFINFI